MERTIATYQYLTPDNLHWASLDIASGDTISASQDLRGFALTGISTPAALDSTSADLEVSSDGVNWVPVYDREGNKLTVVLGAGRHIALSPADLPGFRLLRLRLDAAESADRTFELLIRKLG